MEKEQYLSDFDFELPVELIAQFPLADRTASRLLHVSKDGDIEDLTFKDILKLLRKDDLLVFNNTKVIKARLNGNKESGGAVEAMLERILGEREVLDVLEKFGKVPLPPYITHAASKSDESRYQTVYAKEPGAVAAPTAGLHFTDELLRDIKALGCEEVFVTLHVGAGTFQPVRSEKLSEHIMHSEWYHIDDETANRINRALKEGRRVVCVGTTSLRAVESAAALEEGNQVKAGIHETRLFIKPGYKFKVCGAIVTNFHLPKSTLVMLVSALSGKDEIFKAYKHAVQEKYRFFSYGDACFLEKKETV